MHKFYLHIMIDVSTIYIILIDMIKKPAQKATKKLIEVEKQLVSKILHEIIALRSPEDYDENDVVDNNEKVGSEL